MRTYFAALIVLGTAALPAFAGATSIAPEPGTMLLIGGGLGAVILIARRRQLRNKK